MSDWGSWEPAWHSARIPTVPTRLDVLFHRRRSVGNVCRCDQCALGSDQGHGDRADVSDTKLDSMCAVDALFTRFEVRESSC